MPSAYHMVHYRRFKPSSPLPDSATLESLCRTALDSKAAGGATLWERPADRVFDAGGDDELRIYLNKVADLSSAVFGEMCLAGAKDLQALLNMQPAAVKLSDLTTAVVYNLGERQAPKGSQFIRGMAYWLTIGDHMLFVKTHGMTADLISSYVEWLLTKGTSALPDTISFSMHAEMDTSHAVEDIGDIKSFRLTGKAIPQLTIAHSDDSQKKNIKVSKRLLDKVAQMQQAIPIIEAVFGKSTAESLAKSLGPKEYLAVEASVSVKGSRTATSKATMQNIADELADLSDAKVQIEGKDGKIADGDAILRTRMPFDLPYAGSNFLEFDNVADQLQEVYSRFVNDGKILA